MIPHQEYLSIYVPLDLSSSITQKSSLVKGVMGGKHFRNLGQLHSPLLPFPQSWLPSSKVVGRGWYLVHGCFRAVPAWQLWWPHSFWKGIHRCYTRIKHWLQSLLCSVIFQPVVQKRACWDRAASGPSLSPYSATRSSITH